MKIHTLLSRLPADSFHLVCQNDPDLEICALQIYNADITDFNPHILYVCPGSIPPDMIAGSAVFLCRRKKSETPSTQDAQNFSGPAVLYYTGTRTLLQVKLLLEDIICEEQNYHNAVSVLTESFLSGRGLDHLTETVSSILGGPVFVLSETNRFVSTAGITDKYDRGKIFRLLDQCIRDDGTDHELSFRHGYSSDLEYSFFFIPVKIASSTVGRILFLEQQPDNAQNTHMLLEQFARFVSLEFQKELMDRNGTKTVYSFFLSDLLDGRDMSDPAVQNHLSGTGINLQNDLYVMTVSVCAYHPACAHLNTAAARLCSILNGSIYTIYENMIVIFFSRPEETPLSEQERKALSDQLDSENMQAGMSNFFTDIRHIRRFYIQARKAVEIGTRLNQSASLFFYSDIYFYHIMEICSEKEEIRYFIHPAMMKLLASDINKHSDLLYTLHVFLKYACSTSQTSAALHIHKNTLLYRMNRIREMTGCDLSDGDELLSLAFSYKIMKYLKMLPESAEENNTKSST